MTSPLPTEGDPTDHISVAVDANPVAVNIDDDGMAIDEYFEAANPTPIPRDYLSTGDVTHVPVTTRVLTNSITLAPGASASFFSADPNRQTLIISAVTELGAQPTAFRLTSEPESAVFPLHAGFFFPTNAAVSVTIDCHTGAVWIRNTTETLTTLFTVTSVTV